MSTKITLDELSEMANDLMVSRLTIKSLKDQLDAFMAASPQIVALREQIEEAEVEKDDVQTRLIEAMKSNNLKSWKTEQANFARTVKRYLVCDPEYKKAVERDIKAGGDVEGWRMQESEYLTVKIN